MVIKTQLDFILNPVVETVRLAPLLPSPFPLPLPTSCMSPSGSSSSPSSVFSWISNPAMLATLLRGPGDPVLRHKRDIEQLASLEICKKIGSAVEVLPSISSPCVSPSTLVGCVSTTTGSDGEISDLGSFKKCKSVSLSLRTKTRVCKENGCTSLVVSRRSCVRHGGGSRCTVKGCSNGAKRRNLCFQHGGSTICLASGCNSKAKRYGYCWSHGGGRICSHENCVKVAAQGGSCWAHGGGNRCKLKECNKRSYQKYGYFCKRHGAYNA